MLSPYSGLKNAFSSFCIGNTFCAYFCPGHYPYSVLHAASHPLSPGCNSRCWVSTVKPCTRSSSVKVCFAQLIRSGRVVSPGPVNQALPIGGSCPSLLQYLPFRTALNVLSPHLTGFKRAWPLSSDLGLSEQGVL